jgi:hypothetical protein
MYSISRLFITPIRHGASLHCLIMSNEMCLNLSNGIDLCLICLIIYFFLSLFCLIMAEAGEKNARMGKKEKERRRKEEDKEVEDQTRTKKHKKDKDKEEKKNKKKEEAPDKRAKKAKMDREEKKNKKEEELAKQAKAQEAAKKQAEEISSQFVPQVADFEFNAIFANKQAVAQANIGEPPWSPAEAKHHLQVFKSVTSMLEEAKQAHGGEQTTDKCEWKDGDVPWCCMNCGVEPVGDKPEKRFFWQERKFCAACFGAFEEGFQAAKLVYADYAAALGVQQLRCPGCEPPAAAAPAAAAPAAAAPAAAAPAAAEPLLFVTANVMPPMGDPTNKRMKFATGKLTIEEAFPFVCCSRNCVPKPRVMKLKDGNANTIFDYGQQLMKPMRFQYKQELVRLLVCNMCLQWLLSLFVLIAQVQHVLHNHPDQDTFYLCKRCECWTKNSQQHRIPPNLQKEFGAERHSMWHERHLGDPRVKNADGRTDAKRVATKPVANKTQPKTRSQK